MRLLKLRAVLLPFTQSGRAWPCVLESKAMVRTCSAGFANWKASLRARPANANGLCAVGPPLAVQDYVDLRANEAADHIVATQACAKTSNLEEGNEAKESCTDMHSLAGLVCRAAVSGLGSTSSYLESPVPISACAWSSYTSMK
ncbi:unnamed protein product [Symbiodinium natans]|uniref:Uncharacterized protein n=1 Tax=Symbiodinium natans TaxID=878477 RepID=A0A812NQ54_9DINO|nr:unnamed protein product [Symbiodinium natans]